MIFTKKELPRWFAISSFIILVCIYCMPIMLTGRLYIDDLGRTLYGYTGWGLNGRPLSDLIMSIMSLGGQLVDLSPLNQLIGLALLCITLYFYSIKNLKNISYFGIAITSFLFIANPFFIENLSYRFDSLPMSLSMVMLMIPYIALVRGIPYHLLSVICIIASLSLYQASMGLFIVLAIIEIVSVKAELGNRKVSTSILIRSGQLVSSFVIYKIFIASKFVAGDYNIIHSETLPFSLASLPALHNNIIHVKWFLNSYFSPIPLAIKLLLFISLSYSIFSCSLKLIKDGFKKNTTSILVVITSPILALFFSIAPLVLLKNPVFAPRVMLSISGAIMLFGFFIFSQIKSRALQFVIISPVIWISLVYSYSYATSSKSQSNIDSLISSSIYLDLSKSDKEILFVNVSGEMPKSPQLLISESKLPLMSKLVPIYLSYDWLWGAELLNHYGLKIEYKALGDGRDDMMCKSELISKNKDYNIYYSDKIAFIDFKKIKCHPPQILGGG